MSKHDESSSADRPSLPTRIGRGLSFMNKLAAILVVLGLIAVLLKHH